MPGLGGAGVSRMDIPLPQMRGLAETTRKDRWWLPPLLVFLGFSAFIVYGTWVAFQGNHYVYQGNGANYLSPFYSPLLWEAPNVGAWLTKQPGWAQHAYDAAGAGGPAVVSTGHAWISDAPPMWWPAWMPIAFSPAFLILWIPGGFRFTCYYYRGAYYKSFWADPLNCAVGEPGFRKKNFRGERKLPLTFQNIHRYFLYLALAFIFVLGYDAWCAMWFKGADGKEHFGVGVGTAILAVNVVLISLYTCGCHSLRHIVGGVMDRISGRPIREKVYDCVTCLNGRHMQWAWCSLFSVGFSDVYVRLCSMGVINDQHVILF